MGKFRRWIWLFLILFWGLTSCGIRAISFGKEMPKEEPPQPNPTPVVCTNWPEGMKVRVELKTDTSIDMELEGFQPGDQLVFLFTGEIPGLSSAQLESRPIAVVGKDGRFTWDESLGGTPQINHWQGAIIHMGGVACFDFTLPLLATPVVFPVQQ